MSRVMNEGVDDFWYKRMMNEGVARRVFARTLWKKMGCRISDST